MISDLAKYNLVLWVAAHVSQRIRVLHWISTVGPLPCFWSSRLAARPLAKHAKNAPLCVLSTWKLRNHIQIKPLVLLPLEMLSLVMIPIRSRFFLMSPRTIYSRLAKQNLLPGVVVVYLLPSVVVAKHPKSEFPTGPGRHSYHQKLRSSTNS